MASDKELKRKIGQLMVFGFDGTEVPDHVRRLITDEYVGNIILFSRNIESAVQVRRLTQELQTLARTSHQPWPLTISADQENGVVRRLPPEVPGLPGNMALGATGNPEYAYQAGVLTGRLLRHLGINFNLAPVLDVNNNPCNPVIGVRSFGDNPSQVAEFGVQLALGLQSTGVIACGKHFPGHGDTDVDSHRGLPVIAHPRDRLDTVELVPFMRAIEAGIDVIMTAHVLFSSVESQGLPATLSHPVLTDLLRGECGFRGVVTTDCLEMDAISQTIGVERGAIEALNAGADLIMVSHRLDRQMAVLHAVYRAVQSGEISERRLDEAVERVQHLKQSRLSAWDAAPQEDWDDLLTQTKAFQQEVAKKAVTWIRRLSNVPAFPKRLAVLADETSPTLIAAGPNGPNPLLAQAVKSVLFDSVVQTFEFSSAFSQQSVQALTRELSGFDLIVAGVNGGQNAAYIHLLRTLAANPTPCAVLLLRNPYDATLVRGAPICLALYEETPWMAKAAIRALITGGGQGQVPVCIPDPALS